MTQQLDFFFLYTISLMSLTTCRCEDASVFSNAAESKTIYPEGVLVPVSDQRQAVGQNLKEL